MLQLCDLQFCCFSAKHHSILLGKDKAGLGLVLWLLASLLDQLVKNLPPMGETWVLSLGWENPLEEGMATQSSILAWRIPMNREAWRATLHGVAKSRTQLNDQEQHST